MIALKHALVDDEIAPTVLASVLIDEFDKIWLNWEPAVLWEHVSEEAGVLLSRAQKDKIMAMRVCIKTDEVLTQWPVFLNVARAFNGLSVNPEATTLISPEMIAWTLSELKDIGGDPLEEDDIELSSSVSAILCAILFENGLAFVPEDPMGEMIKHDLVDYIERYNPEAVEFAIDAESAYYNVLNGLKGPTPGSPEAIHTMKLLLIDAYVAGKREEKQEDIDV